MSANKKKSDPSKSVKPVPMELDEKGREKLARMAADLPGLLTYAHTAGGFKIVPSEAGKIKKTALRVMEEQVTSQMDQIMEQMQLLAKQAQTLKSRVHVSQLIYDAEMGFAPVVGNTYFLYGKANGKCMLSMIAPDQWNSEKKASMKPMASVSLMADHTWKVIEEWDLPGG